MNRFRIFLAHVASYFPSTLPIGMTEFETWADSICLLLPKGLDSVPREDKHWVIASAIQHLPSTSKRVSKQYFIRIIHKGAASQIAAQVFMNVKEQKELKKKQLEAQQAAATPTQGVDEKAQDS